jgi:hypothetical protein
MQSIAKKGELATVRKKKMPEITVERLELYLDRLAEIMSDPYYNAEDVLPIYERIESEIALRRQTGDKIAAIRERATRLKGQRAALWP